MPRPRDIVTLQTTEAQRKEAVRRKAIEVHNPYRVFKQHRADGFTRKGFCLVYVHPFTGERENVMQDIEDAATAKDLREILETSWVRGYVASGENGS